MIELIKFAIVIYGLAVFAFAFGGAFGMVVFIQFKKDDPDYVTSKIAFVWCLFPPVAFVKMMKFRNKYYNSEDEV